METGKGYEFDDIARMQLRIEVVNCEIKEKHVLSDFLKANKEWVSDSDLWLLEMLEETLKQNGQLRRVPVRKGYKWVIITK